jgi:3-oxoacid CoA-transferase subunit A
MASVESEGRKEMILITGDTHGDFERIREFCAGACTGEEDVLVILGDAGINFYGNPSDAMLKQTLSDLPINLLCIHGNHERRPETIDTYAEVMWNGLIALRTD